MPLTSVCGSIPFPFPTSQDRLRRTDNEFAIHRLAQWPSATAHITISLGAGATMLFALLNCGALQVEETVSPTPFPTEAPKIVNVDVNFNNTASWAMYNFASRAIPVP